MAEWGRNYGAHLTRALGFTRQPPCAAMLHTALRHSPELSIGSTCGLRLQYLYSANVVGNISEGIRFRRDTLLSITYSEELIFPISATLQSTDRHHGMVGQERCHFQLDS